MCDASLKASETNGLSSLLQNISFHRYLVNKGEKQFMIIYYLLIITIIYYLLINIFLSVHGIIYLYLLYMYIYIYVCARVCVCVCVCVEIFLSFFRSSYKEMTNKKISRIKLRSMREIRKSHFLHDFFTI